jgi:signal peptidase I
MYFVFTFILTLAFVILFRIFLFEVYTIPSGSMKNTILPGDKVLVNKLYYGPRLPNSPNEIPWVNLFWNLTSNGTIKNDSIYWDYPRLKGISKMKTGDVMVFNHPLLKEKNNYFIKRCMAVPADTFMIEDSQLKVNGMLCKQAKSMKKIYHLWTNNPREFSDVRDKIDIDFNHNTFPSKNDSPMKLLLTIDQKTKLLKSNCVDSIKPEIVANDSSNWVYPKVRNFAWTISNYGPLIVPYKDYTIQLNQYNFLLYSRTINRLERVKLEQINGRYYLDGVIVEEYTFKHNYYFMVGDNFYFSRDSRYWGFVPEVNIVGRASIILYNLHFCKFCWDRFLKRIE